MALRLVLVRHAKAEAHRGDDKSRELAARGRADATAVGRWLVQQGIRPDRVVVSSSVGGTPGELTVDGWKATRKKYLIKNSSFILFKREF